MSVQAYVALPFERGKTAYEAGIPDLTLSATLGDEWLGREFEVTDTEHGTGEMIRLRVVKAMAAITVARKAVSFGTAALSLGRKTASPAIQSSGTAGLLGLMIDDAYDVGKVIAQYDLFFCVVRGWCSALVVERGTLAQHGPVMQHTDGSVMAATAASHVIGIADQTQGDPGSSGATVVIYCTGLAASDAAS
jgi:hypothetical protein